MAKKSYYISMYRDPVDKSITLELGKINPGEMVYRYDEKKEDFIPVGYPHLLEYIRLPRPMTADEANEWIGTQESIRMKCAQYSESNRGDPQSKP